LVTHGNIGTAAACLAVIDLTGWAIEKMYNEQVRQDVIASVLPNAIAVADKKAYRRLLLHRITLK